MEVTRIDPLHPDALRLIAGSEAEQSALYPPHLRHAFSPQQLIDDDIRFYAACRDGAALACGGYGSYDGYAELKRIYVDPAHRGAGLADAIIDICEADAAAEGLPLMRLETGEASPAALRIYTRLGYTRCGPFGPYEENGSSVFMEKPL
ncbi:GNAT family N-acetyltransferase [Aestuariibius sp. 2305UL40-4]|uniref:GNAT family N-acetyltransferase n=1 Tax=Aestuariibius violaceus TaxID=3234132 RepID=UPI00345E337C